MYKPNHVMLSLVPPHGTQLVGTVDGSYMFIFDRSLKEQVLLWLEGITAQAQAQSSSAPVVSSSGTSAAPVQGKVLKGDVTFEFAATPPKAAEKLDETVHVSVGDTERPPATEPHNEIPTP